MSRTERQGIIEDSVRNLREIRDRFIQHGEAMAKGLPDLSKAWLRFAIIYMENASHALSWSLEELPEVKKNVR